MMTHSDHGSIFYTLFVILFSFSVCTVVYEVAPQVLYQSCNQILIMKTNRYKCKSKMYISRQIITVYYIKDTSRSRVCKYISYSMHCLLLTRFEVFNFNSLKDHNCKRKASDGPHLDWFLSTYTKMSFWKKIKTKQNRKTKMTVLKHWSIDRI